MKNDLQRVLRIRDAIAEVEKDAALGKGVFEDDPAVYQRICRNLETIAQMTKEFSHKIQSRFPEIDWSRIVAMETFSECSDSKFDSEIVWLSVEQDIPVVKEEMRAIFASLETLSEPV